MYRRYATLKGLKHEVLVEDQGHIVLKIMGYKAGTAFSAEGGKHCVQRVPNNDRSGRRQTSFVNVAVLPLPPIKTFIPLPERDLEIKTQTGKQKAGGQNANKVASAVRMKHKPSGLTVFINGRDQKANRQEALRILTARVNELANKKVFGGYSDLKGSQLEERGRGDKIRTYNFCDSYVIDHRSGRKTSNIKAVIRGELTLVL